MNPGPQNARGLGRAAEHACDAGRRDRADSGVLVISPHFDDAVLGCGAFLAGRPGSIVMTVCAGVPPENAPLPDWDRRCGFSSARAAMLARIRENRHAMSQLRTIDVRLDLLDSQYGGRCAGLGRRLAQELERRRPGIILLPLGLFHEDHIRVSDASLAARQRLGDRPLWIAYEDALYRRRAGLVQQRLAVLRARGVCATPWLTVPADVSVKRRAVAAYASQLGPLGLMPGRGDDALPEHYWRLSAGAQGDG
ncbi:PIG-L family deacetylase [Castellaniella ginsengisoli]|uniref:PIG-L family deacetylase n=1 Tax=Castellaniella ginsengisoli TaxID=546114 RepID=A0AB39ES18_9BURK